MKITKLTEAQIAKFPEHVDKYIQIGLSTEPADFDAATDAALKAYAFCNLDKPMVILRMGSPYGATLGGALAFGLLKELKQKTTEQVRSQVWSQVESQVESQVWSQVWSQVGSEVESQVESQVGSEVESQVRSQVESQVGDAVYNYRGGCFWAGWGAYISFLRDECGWDGDTLNKFEIDEALIKSCGWVWWHENVLAISDRPLEINQDEQGRLHGEGKPSMTYRDGWKLYHWHGVAIPAEWVENKQSLTAKLAITWENVEQRRAACEIVGWQNVLKELNAREIDKDDDAEIGTLLEVDLPDSGKERFLQVQCGTKRVFAIPVPPQTKTALEGQAWIHGFDNVNEFLIPEIRT